MPEIGPNLLTNLSPNPARTQKPTYIAGPVKGIWFSKAMKRLCSILCQKHQVLYDISCLQNLS